MFVLSIAAIVQMRIYSSFKGLSILGEFVTPTAYNSFGNIGFSGPVCSKTPINWDDEKDTKLVIRCQETTKIKSVLASGLMIDNNIAGNYDAVYGCYADPIDPKTGEKTYEMSHFNNETFVDRFMSECEGKSICKPHFPSNTFTTLTKDTARLNMVLFVQAECSQDDAELWNKKAWGLAIACIGLLMCIFWATTIRLILNVDKIYDKLIDMDLVTVDDYTVQTRLRSAIYDNFLKNNMLMAASSIEAPIMTFKKELIKSIKEQLV